VKAAKPEKGAKPQKHSAPKRPRARAPRLPRNAVRDLRRL
jgi:hypothetical protein